MKVYHGTEEKFEKFSYDKMGTHGQSEGMGFYFTDDYDVARSYAEHDGYIIEADIDTSKVLSTEKITISRQDIIKIINNLPDENDFLCNFGDIDYCGKEKILEEALNLLLKYNKNDADIMHDMATIHGNRGEILTAFNKALGFTAIVCHPDWKSTQTIIIALTDDVIKNRKRTHVTNE